MSGPKTVGWDRYVELAILGLGAVGGIAVACLAVSAGGAQADMTIGFPPDASGKESAVEKSETAEEPERTAEVVLPLAKVEPIPIPDYSLDDLTAIFPAFEHEPFETAGFNHLTLPFLYLSRTSGGDPAEALAFSFLLSNSIDWAPGGYCTRHAYFTFKRARRYMRKLAQRYNPTTIKMAIQDWEATYAVGGTLIRGAGCYAGTLRIYDRVGRTVFRKQYRRSPDYFDLLGDMAVDAIRFFGGEPTPALIKHLHRKRCKDHESIIDLGRAAFIEEKSPAEFRIYERILDRDPHFTDVRYWYGNQRQWKDHDRARYMAQMERALDSYLVEAAAIDFTPEEHPDPETAAEKKAAYLKRLEELVGPDFPSLVRCKLKAAFQEKVMSPQLRERATRIAARYPNCYYLLTQLGQNYGKGYELGADCDMGASIILAALRNRYLTSRGDKRWGLAKFQTILMNLGRDDIAVAVIAPTYGRILKQQGGFRYGSFPEAFATALHRSGRHREAIRVYDEAIKAFRGETYFHNRVTLLRGIAAAHAGDLGALEQTIEHYGDPLREAGTLFILEAYRDLLMGRALKIADLRKKSGHDLWYASRGEDILYSQIALLAGKQQLRGKIRWWVNYNPMDRAFCILYDLYARREPRPDDVLFYEMLDWLYRHDPWARQAVADFHARVGERAGEPSPWTPQKVAEVLKNFQPIRYPRFEGNLKSQAQKAVSTLPPGAVASALHHLIRENRFDEADDLARRHLHMAVEYNYFGRRVHAHHLIHLVQQAREQAASSGGGT